MKVKKYHVTSFNVLVINIALNVSNYNFFRKLTAYSYVTFVKSFY